MVAGKEIVRGALLRFVPTVLVVMGLIALTGVIVGRGGVSVAGAAMGAVEIAGLTVGYVAALLAIGKRLRDDASVGGRRANVAALGSILALVATSMVVQGVSPLRAFGLSALAGGAVTVALFAPWIGRRAAAPTAGWGA